MKKVSDVSFHLVFVQRGKIHRFAKFPPCKTGFCNDYCHNNNMISEGGLPANL